MPACPLSCGVCTFSCKDANADCPGWAKLGECDSNPSFMLPLCPTSCGLCKPVCADTDDKCPGFAHLGECEKNSDWMARNCPVSCEYCERRCLDKFEECPRWVAVDECTNSARPDLEPTVTQTRSNRHVHVCTCHMCMHMCLQPSFRGATSPLPLLDLPLRLCARSIRIGAQIQTSCLRTARCPAPCATGMVDARTTTRRSASSGGAPGSARPIRSS